MERWDVLLDRSALRPETYTRTLGLNDKAPAIRDAVTSNYKGAAAVPNISLKDRLLNSAANINPVIASVAAAMIGFSFFFAGKLYTAHDAPIAQSHAGAVATQRDLSLYNSALAHETTGAERVRFGLPEPIFPEKPQRKYVSGFNRAPGS